MKYLLISVLAFSLLFACSLNQSASKLDLDEAYLNFKSNINDSYAIVAKEITTSEKDLTKSDELLSIFATAFDVTKEEVITNRFLFKSSDSLSLVAKKMATLVEVLKLNSFQNVNVHIQLFLSDIDSDLNFSEDEKLKLVYFASFYSETIFFINQNYETLILNNSTSFKVMQSGSAECLLGMIGDDITYGIAVAGVGCAIGVAAGGVPTLGIGAGPGCVTGASVGVVVGFIGGLFKGAADHYFN